MIKMMKKATLPLEKAVIPKEQARQSVSNNDGHSARNKDKRNLKFSNESNGRDSQSSLYKEVLSQPFGLSHRERLLWLQKRRTEGLWVQCNDCDRWRYLSQVIDRYELPEKWFCKMNPDTTLAKCSVSEEPIHLHDEEDLIHSRFSAGSVVWAQMPGWPWWPAMVDDCPDTEQFYWLDGFSDIPTAYNVVFFDKSDATRAWISNNKIESYCLNKNRGNHALQNIKYTKRLKAAIRQAEDALNMPLTARLAKYSFLSRYKGKILSPTKISKADIEKYRKRLKRTFNVEFPLEFDTDDSDIDDCSATKLDTPKVNKDSVGATPTKSKVKAIKPKKIFIKTKETMNTHSTNEIDAVSANLAKHSQDDETKEINSLAAHVNRADFGLINGLLEKDTSETSVPESLVLNTLAESNSLIPHDRADSPASDDFEF